ncbi:MAG: hypothetical protein A2017_09210 [Lentisphaerae bacterium GWF2_44_16]|nr:MAG: hypothetical protein A2017_09210 [Lentisphaerae bacterium GWF2_44_16]
MRAYTITNGQCTPGLPECFCPAANTDIKIKVIAPLISTEKAPEAIKTHQDTFTYGLAQISVSDSPNDNSGYIALAFNATEYHPADDTLLLVDYREPYILVLSVPSRPILLSKDSAFTITSDGQLQAMPLANIKETPTYEIL